MYVLERKEAIARPNILGNCSFPVHTYRWKQICMCEEKEPLDEIFKDCVPQENYRIESRWSR